MLRVGLTGGLGSGKSTLAAMLQARGAHVLNSDNIARELMSPGQAVYAAIVARFGLEVLAGDGELDRRALARIAFGAGRVEELNRIVHPAVIARQMDLMDAIGNRDPGAVVVVESALIFETQHGGAGGWQTRFDFILLVTAPEDLRIQRFVDRMSSPTDPPSRRAALAQEARNRIAHQKPDSEKLPLSDVVLRNDGDLSALEQQVDALWPQLLARARVVPGEPSAGESSR